MKPRSAKNKGQRAVKELKKILLERFSQQLKPDDLRVTPSGVSGADLWLSPRAQEVLGDVDFEVKNREHFSIWTALDQVKKRSGEKTPILVFKKNASELHVTLRLKDFLNYYEEWASGKRVRSQCS